MEWLHFTLLVWLVTSMVFCLPLFFMSFFLFVLVDRGCSVFVSVFSFTEVFSSNGFEDGYRRRVLKRKWEAHWDLALKVRKEMECRKVAGR